MIAIEQIACSLPEKCLTNDELRAAFPEWDFERLEKRTGVLRRQIAADGETALDFAVRASQRLIDDGKLLPQDVDAVIFCTQTPDFVMPPNACLLHGRLGLKPGTIAFDITLACSGYIYGLQLGASLIQSGAACKVLLATSDTYTRYIHPGDRATRCLFGDGGAVTVLAESTNGSGIRDIRCGTSGTHYEKFIVKAGGMRVPRSADTSRETVDRSGNVRTPEHIQMDGLGVLSFFNATVPRCVRDILQANGLTMDDIDLFVFHQASQLALDSLTSALNIPRHKMVYDLEETGNLVSASIPVALSRALERERASRGQLALLCGFGVGLSWGAALVKL
jgi:3-oxoacyl-[acyl-carrier-protein] synthase III